MFSSLERAAEQVDAAWQARLSLPLPENARFVDKLVIAALSDASTATELFATLVAETLNLPVAICVATTTPLMPADKRRSSFLTIAAIPKKPSAPSIWLMRVARKVLAITSGGALAEYAKRSGVALWHYAFNGVSRLAFTHAGDALAGARRAAAQ